MANVSSDFIIASIGRKFGIETTKYKIQMFESIGAALGRLDIRVDKETKYLITDTNDFIVCKPIGCLSVLSVTADNRFVPNKQFGVDRCIKNYYGDYAEFLRVAKATKRAKEIKIQELSCIEDIPCDIEERILKVYNGQVETYTAFHTQVRHNHHRNYWWEETEQTVKTNFQSDNVIIQYQSTKVDDNGFPMIPDEQKLIEYIEYYTLRDILFSGYKHPVLSLSDVNMLMEKAESRATNHFRKRTPQQMELFMRKWTNQLEHIREDFYSNTVYNQFNK